MSERDFGERAGGDGADIDLEQHFAQLLGQLEACGCGPVMPQAGDDEDALNAAALPPACGPVLENISELLDHVMPSELERMIMEHSEHCEQCGPAVNAELRLRELVKRSCSAQAPESLRMRVTTITAQYRS